MAHNAKPPKPAGQGSNAPAPTQAVNAFNKPGPSNSNGMPDKSSNTAHNWQDHASKGNPGGYGG
jgi:hypothetical protein